VLLKKLKTNTALSPSTSNLDFYRSILATVLARFETCALADFPGTFAMSRARPGRLRTPGQALKLAWLEWACEPAYLWQQRVGVVARPWEMRDALRGVEGMLAPPPPPWLS